MSNAEERRKHAEAVREMNERHLKLAAEMKRLAMESMKERRKAPKKR